MTLPIVAQSTPAPSVYVSTGSGEQLLQLNGDSGDVIGMCNLSFVPEDVVIGPDGKLYVADTAGNRIWRLSSSLPAPTSSAPATACSTEMVYDATTASCTALNGSTTCPTGPEGPSFLRINTLDLYFNTHGTNSGVWKIKGIADQNCTDADCGTVKQVVSSFGSSASGEGTEFDIFGNLLAVNQSGNQVVRAIAPAFASAQPFITTKLSSPYGIALNTCGDVLVASGKYVNRYDGSTGAYLDRLSFSGNNYPKFLEVDAANRLFVTTAADESGKNGTVWGFAPPHAGTNSAVTSCSLPSYSLAWTQTLSTKTYPALVSGTALGLGLGPSTVSLTETLNAANNYTATFNFGAQHSFSVTCETPAASQIPLTVTALRSRPTDASNAEVQFSPSSLWPGTTTQQCPVQIQAPTCVHYGSLHGFCTQYVESTPQNQPDVSVSCPGTAPGSSNFLFKIGFFTAEFLHDPGGAHSSGSNSSDAYTDCQSQDFYSTAGPGLDAGARLSGSNSKHVMFNSSLYYNGAITLTSPVSSCSPSGNCNPQFNAGQNIAVKFNLSNANGAITQATEQLSVIRVQHTTNGVTTNELVAQTVTATNNSASLNFFSPNSSGQYSYNLNSSAFDPLPVGTTAVYQFNIWGNGADPYMFNVIVQF